MLPQDPKAFPHASKLRAGRISSGGETYYVTKCVEGRRPLLAKPDSAEAIIDSLVFARAKGRIKLLAFVVMPDHYHVLLTLMPGEELSRLMQSIGSFTANRIRDLLGYRGVVWQRDGYYEHRCRNESEVLGCAAYIHHNPVRKGLVVREEDWIASSAHPSRRPLLEWEWWA